MKTHFAQWMYAMTGLFLLSCGQNETPDEKTVLKQKADFFISETNRVELPKLSEKLTDFKLVDACLVARDGRLIYENYLNGYDRDRLHDFASVTKSITSLLVGISVDNKWLSTVDEPLAKSYIDTDYESYWVGHFGEITWKHVLSMQHGLDSDDYNDPGMKNFNSWLKEKDPVEAIFKIPVKQKPGMSSSYSTATTQWLRQPLEKVSGMPVQRLAKEFLFEPLEIEDVKWKKTNMDTIALGYGGQFRPIDILKIGLMIQNDGRWNDQVIVSSSWIKESFKRHGTLLGIDYGLLWYSESYQLGGMDIQSHLAMGHGGQFLILFPELKVTVVIAASDYNSSLDFYSFVGENILPSLIK